MRKGMKQEEGMNKYKTRIALILSLLSVVLPSKLYAQTLPTFELICPTTARGESFLRDSLRTRAFEQLDTQDITRLSVSIRLRLVSSDISATTPLDSESFGYEFGTDSGGHLQISSVGADSPQCQYTYAAYLTWRGVPVTDDNTVGNSSISETYGIGFVTLSEPLLVTGRKRRLN